MEEFKIFDDGRVRDPSIVEGDWSFEDHFAIPTFKGAVGPTNIDKDSCIAITFGVVFLSEDVFENLVTVAWKNSHEIYDPDP